MDPDVIVSGAGPAGAFAAVLLARAGVRVTLIDRETFPRHKLCGDTLNPGGLALLRRHRLHEPIEQHGVPLDGMLVTGESGVRISGTYGPGLVGRAWCRSALDQQLLHAAASAGAEVRTGVLVQEPYLSHAAGRVGGVRLKTGDGRSEVLRARWTIAADGRRSRLALALGLIRQPAQPRRWAIGTYASGVSELGTLGEMHVRRGHYIGVAPAAGGAANLCLVTADRAGLHDPARRLWAALHADPLLRERCAQARPETPVVLLGPLAVDARTAGAPGLLLAGDAAGFIDPMTGDGLHLALQGGRLAADVLVEGWTWADDAVIARLQRRRRAVVGGKLRFNRALRLLVGWPMGVRLGAAGAAVLPSVLQRVIATAGDVSRATEAA
ncbi:MAG: NAD(P)/FAD-dependent oxidoreductase [Luteitalea sp.]